MTDKHDIVAEDHRQPWSTPLVIGTVPAREAEIGSITSYPENAPTPFGGTGGGS